MADEPDTARAELLAALDALSELLQRYGEQHWADWLTRDRRCIQNGDADGINHLLRGYGGMGSLNDVVIHPVNGHHIAAQDVDTVNKRLSQLRSRTYAAATRLEPLR